MQDLGAAGLSCAASETAAKGGVGMDVDLARVAKREPGMNAVEVMTSESQERMLAIVEPARLDAVLDLARKWEIRATVVGRVTDSDRFRVFDGVFDALGVPGENPAPPIGDTPPSVSSDRAPVADVPVGSLGDGPLYHRPTGRPAAQDALLADDPAPRLRAKFPAGSDLSGELLALLATPTIADKTWVSRQYDHQLFLSTVAGPGADAAVLRVKGTRKALALATDGKARFCHLDPRVGAQLVVLEAARNVACTGGAAARARELPQLRRSRARRGDVAVHRGRRRHERGVRGARHPGDRRQRLLLQRVARRRHPPDAGRRRARADRRARRPAPGARFAAGESIVVLGETRAELGGSEWAAVVHGLDGGAPPVADLDAAVKLHALVADLVREREVAGVHDVSDGGLAVALCEMAFGGRHRLPRRSRDRARRPIAAPRPRPRSASRPRGSSFPSHPTRWPPCSAPPRPPASPPP